MYTYIKSVNKYLLSVYQAPDAVLGTGDREQNWQSTHLRVAYVLVEAMGFYH